MASQPKIDPTSFHGLQDANQIEVILPSRLDPGPPLSREEGFALLETMYGFMHDVYERTGGVEAAIREMRGEEPDTDPR